MKKPEQKYEKMPAPRLHEDVKKMNGRSTRRLSECIDILCDVLDEDTPQKAEDGSVSPRSEEKPQDR